ncbi:MAG: alpha/beta hydrolase [Gammaproteobacteria bacterium]|nr:alpha/beta hydrolase [Gammaproteobacteria bacterium]
MSVHAIDTPLTQSDISDHLITTQNGSVLSTRLFTAPQAKSVVIMAGAMGVVQQCYEKFAKFLSENHHHVITFDYVGTGQSLNTPLKHCKTDILGWGEQDCNAMLAFAQAQYPDLPIQWIGHSVGAQLLGMTSNINQIKQAITLAAGSGYWRENSPPTKKMVWFLWYFVAPISVNLMGYFPGKKLNMVGDLPANVMRQWRRWCLNKEYAVGYEGKTLRNQYATVNIPITAISFEDDEMMSKANIDSLHGFFSGANVTHQRLTQEDTQGQFVGHLGWFREKFKEPLWAQQILPILNR